ncbi:hypothetical protein [Arenibaculum pallidiluteum]|uniref:hypothetical protein n=1 Tax=Arenibaculum pallidiluteum TaxID=2812559 RepID=UPI001A96EF07|nr:hypothetical protein [Arenibaculum pallidiluteum]
MCRISAERGKLAYYGIKPNMWVMVRPWLIGAVILLILLLILLWLKQPIPDDAKANTSSQETAKDAVEISVIIFGFVFGYIQWIMARYESSLDKFYDRLDVANNRLGAMVDQSWSQATPGTLPPFNVYTPPDPVGVSLFDMWVFAELDNLEYVVEKYTWGFLTPTLACRAVETFKSRCVHDKTFTERALNFAAASGYRKTTRIIVERIRSDIQPLAELQQPDGR